MTIAFSCLSEFIPEWKVRFLVGWVEPLGYCWVSYLNPTYENRAIRNLQTLMAKPNKSFTIVFVQPLIHMSRLSLLNYSLPNQILF